MRRHIKFIASHPEGFSAIELIAVLVIIGVVSAVVVPKIVSSVTEIDVIGQAAVIKSQLYYAQSLSMNSSSTWGICCDGSHYWLFRNGDIDNKVTLPGEDSDTVSLADKNIAMPAFTVSFDEWGAPYTDASAATPQTEDRTITVSSSSGGETESIVITRNTGFVS